MSCLNPIRLSDLHVGDLARLYQAELDASTADLLRALGLTRASQLRLCKTGDPYIIQIRATRIGLSREVARHILVTPVAGESGCS